MESEKYTVSMACGRSHGDRAEYTCRPGYTLSGGSLQTTCQTSGVWTNLPPTCTQVGCGPPPSPTNGSVDFSAGTNTNEIATYSCDPGFGLTGSTTTQCLLTDLWSNPPPNCTLVECGALNAPDHGSVDTSNGVTYQDIAVYSCNEAYRLSGSNTTACQSNGTWSNPEPVCAVVNCGVPPIPRYGSNSFYNTTYLSEAEYHCPPGYTLSGSSFAVCLSNGSWSGSVPSCQPVDCGFPTSPENGTVYMPNGTLYQSPTIYTCTDGFVLNGSETRFCSANGAWNGTIPVCEQIDCGVLESPYYGIVNISDGTTFLKTATYKCDTGFMLNGSDTRTCRESNFWDGQEPECIEITCSNLTVPYNCKIVLSNGTNFNSYATYTCPVGYSLVGDRVRMCQEDGRWSGWEPSCIIVDCGRPLDPTHGQVHALQGTTFGNEVTYSCSRGYELLGTEIRYCGYNGSWTGSDPTCELLDCGRPENISSFGHVTFDNGTTYEQLAIYSCHTGYTVNGSSIRQCNVSGWEPALPTCEMIGT